MMKKIESEVHIEDNSSMNKIYREIIFTMQKYLNYYLANYSSAFR